VSLSQRMCAAKDVARSTGPRGVILSAGALALASLEHGDIRVGLVGQERLEAVAVLVGE
jgi:hypothetical protein